MINKQKNKIINISFLLFITLIIILVFLFVPPISQNLSYHHFSDDTNGTFHALNVLTNIPFFIAGVFGLYTINHARKKNGGSMVLFSYALMFIGVILTCFGSSYYHLTPNNHTLIWDRLPMTFAFMALISAMIGDMISKKFGAFLLFPLLAIGVFSVFYWNYTEQHGAGDLRLYLIVQFLSIFTAFLIVILYKTPKHYKSYFFGMFIFYILAKITETYDIQIHDFLVIIGGHPIKHMLAATGVFIFAISFLKRTDKI